jgi:hypothetical protein
MRAAHDRSRLKLNNGRWLAAAALLVTLTGPLAAGAARADANLSWGSTLVKTQKGLRGCYDVATGALERAGLDNIRATSSQVSGSTDNVFVAVTCIGTRPRPTAVVMVTSESSGDAQDARNKIVRFIRK